MHTLLVTACLMLACSISAHSQEIRYQGSGYWGVESAYVPSIGHLDGLKVGAFGALSERVSFGLRYEWFGHLGGGWISARVVDSVAKPSLVVLEQRWVRSISTVSPWIAYRYPGADGIDVTFDFTLEQTWCEADDSHRTVEYVQNPAAGITASYRLQLERDRAVIPFLGIRYRRTVYDVYTWWQKDYRLSFPLGCRIDIGEPNRRQFALSVVADFASERSWMRFGLAYSIPSGRTGI